MEYMTIGLLDKLMDKVSNEEKILELHSHLNDVNVDDIKLTFIQTAGEFREINIIFNPNNQGNLIPYFMKNNGYIYYDAKNFDNIKNIITDEFFRQYPLSERGKQFIARYLEV